MSRHRLDLERSLALCDDLHDDDGRPQPRRDASPRSPSARRKHARKRDQLCHQIAQSVTLNLSELAQDASLDGLLVLGVEPSPDANHLRVWVSPSSPPEPEHPVDMAQLERRLSGATGALRALVARDIHRKRVPELTLTLVPYGWTP